MFRNAHLNSGPGTTMEFGNALKAVELSENLTRGQGEIVSSFFKLTRTV